MSDSLHPWHPLAKLPLIGTESKLGPSKEKPMALPEGVPAMTKYAPNGDKGSERCWAKDYRPGLEEHSCGAKGEGRLGLCKRHEEEMFDLTERNGD